MIEPGRGGIVECLMCFGGEMGAGTATVTLIRDDMVVAYLRVPAYVCEQCGEEYIGAGVAEALETASIGAQQNGVRFAVQEYAAA